MLTSQKDTNWSTPGKTRTVKEKNESSRNKKNNVVSL